MLEDDLLQEIRSRLALGGNIQFRSVPNPAPVADSTRQYVADTTRGQLILVISSDASPLMVKRGVDRQRMAKTLLNGHAAAAIELPVIEGVFTGRSFAVWPARKPLSANRVRSKIERMLLAPIVFRWLGEIASQTVTAANPAKLAENARRLQSLASAPKSVRIAAEKAGDAFVTGAVPALQVLQHGDLWPGNILWAPTETRFIVIDWPGARPDGSPFFDFFQFATLVGASKYTLYRQLKAYCQSVGCTPCNAHAYLLSALGALHVELEHFPENSFFTLCERLLNALDPAIAL